MYRSVIAEATCSNFARCWLDLYVFSQSQCYGRGSRGRPTEQSCSAGRSACWIRLRNYKGCGWTWVRPVAVIPPMLSDFCSFDTVKTRMQCAPPGTYRGAIDVVRQTVRNEGYRALFKGMTPPMVAWSGVDALLMASLHNYRLMLIRLGMTETNPRSGQLRLTIFAHGVAGLMAGCTSTILGTPMEHLKVRLQLQMQRSTAERDFKGPIDCVRRVIQVQGVRGLWSGFTGSLAFRSNFFWMFLSVETLMRVFSESQYIQLSTGTSTFLAGGLASFVYWTMAMPADNLKNRMMAYPYPARYPTSRSATFKIPSIRTVASSIYRTEGLKGFFRGLTPSLLRAFPANACALYVYESTMSLLDAEKTRH